MFCLVSLIELSQQVRDQNVIPNQCKNDRFRSSLKLEYNDVAVLYIKVTTSNTNVWSDKLYIQLL